VASHIGQLFFDQSLQHLVEYQEPYASNTQSLTTNDEDSILAAEADSSDPMVRYVLLGDNVADGVLGWISIGIYPTATRDVHGISFPGSRNQSEGSGVVESGEGNGVATATTGGGGGSTSDGSRMVPGLRLLLPFWFSIISAGSTTLLRKTLAFLHLG
jgi:hypothetical protein